MFKVKTGFTHSRNYVNIFVLNVCRCSPDAPIIGDTGSRQAKLRRDSVAHLFKPAKIRRSFKFIFADVAQW